MTTMHFVVSGKANVGKSAFTEVLSAIAHLSGHQPFLVDADIHRQTLSKVTETTRQVAMKDDPLYESQPDQFWVLAEKQEADVIVDLAGQTDSLLNNWLDNRAVTEAAREQHIKIMKWWICDSDTVSLRELADSAERFPTVQHVLVKAYYRAPELLWESLDLNSDVKRAIRNGVETCIFPRLHTGLLDRLRASQIAIKDVAENASLGALDKSTIRRWVERNHTAIAPIYNFPKTKLTSAKKKKLGTTRRKSTAKEKANA